MFTAYAGFWLSYALLIWIFLPQVVAANGPVSDLVGWFLLAGLSHASGYVRLLDAAVALFLSAAAIVNDTCGRIVIAAP